MNNIKLKGTLSDIEFSHMINNIEYQKAILKVKKENGELDLLPLKFKSSCNTYIEGQEITIDGNIRSYSQRLPNNKNRVNIYVFSYLDPTEDLDIYNYFQIDGRICKLDKLRGFDNSKRFQFILANNIISSLNKQKINNYLPIITYGDIAEQCSHLNISDQIILKGQLHSRLYKKVDSKGNISVRTAIELVASDIEIL